MARQDHAPTSQPPTNPVVFAVNPKWIAEALGLSPDAVLSLEN